MAVDRGDVTPPSTPRRARDVPVMNGKKRVHSKHLTHLSFTSGKHKTMFMKDDDEDEDEDDAGDLQNSPSSSKRRRVGDLAFAPVSANHNNGRLRSSKASLLEQRRQLPIWKGKESLKQAVRQNDTIVILGETGSGKTTQVPQFLLEAEFGERGLIGITQPRKVAATSLATRVAAEQAATLGHLVGYSVRFDEKCGRDTRIKYLTDGMLVRELLSDRLLSQYSVLIIDEAHERTLRTDLLLSSLKSIQKERNGAVTMNSNDRKGKHRETTPLKVITMSATLDAERFSRFFNNAKIFYVQGRQHAVTTYFSEEPQADFVESALQTLFQIHVEQPPGDVLVFLPGQDQIESLEKSIKFHCDQIPEGTMKVHVCTLYAALPQHLQNRVFQPAEPGTRKIVLATNIAETSITIPGIKYVIDTGLCKEKQYIVSKNRGSGLEALVLKPISKSSAQQRAGRAGREGPGICYRLYTEQAYRQLRESALPEIQRCNLTFAVLQMKCLGQDPTTADYMDAPHLDHIKHSLGVLYGLEALGDNGLITALGRSIAQFPLDPPSARALLASKDTQCTLEAIIVLSLLSTSGTVLLEPVAPDMRDTVKDVRSKFRHPSGDHLTLLNIYRTYEDILRGASYEINGGSGNNGGRHAAKDWCTRHFINERALKEARDIANQLSQICQKLDVDPTLSCGEDTDRVLRTILLGRYQSCAFLSPEGTYLQVFDKQPVKIIPSSTLFQRKVSAIMYDELVLTNNTYARTVSSVQPSWIADLSIYCRRSA